MITLLEISPFRLAAASVVPVVFNYTLKSILLLAVTALMALAWHRSSASRRHALWTVAVAATLALPLFSRVLPPGRTVACLDWGAMIRWLSPATEQARASAALPPFEVERPRPGGPGTASLASSAFPPDPLRSSRREQRSSDAIAFVDRAETKVIFHRQLLTSEYASARSGDRATASWSWLATVAWMFGVAMCLRCAAFSSLALRRLERQSQRITSGPGYEMLERIRERLGIRGNVQFLIGTRHDTPMAWGMLRPTVYLPKSAAAWSRNRLTAVLTHELGHIRRRDALTQWMVQIACAIYWVNPFIWYAARRIRVEREQACDDMVVSHGVDATDYAEHLLRIAASLGPCRAGAVGLSIATPSRVEQRVQALLHPETNRQTVSSGILCTIVAVGLSISLPLAVLRGAGEDGPTTAELPETRQKTPRDAPPVRLSHVDDTAESWRSIAGSGHAVRFQRTDAAAYLTAVEIFANRYGSGEAAGRGLPPLYSRQEPEAAPGLSLSLCVD